MLVEWNVYWSVKPIISLHPDILQIDLAINYTDHHHFGFLDKIFSYRNKQRQYRKKLSKVLITLKVDIDVSMFDHNVTFINKINDGSQKVLEIHFSRYNRIQYNSRGLWIVLNLW